MFKNDVSNSHSELAFKLFMIVEVIGRQLEGEVKSLSPLGIKEMTPRRCDTDNLPELKASLKEYYLGDRRRPRRTPW